MLLGTSFIDCFVRSIFPSERKVVSWLSHSLAISVVHINFKSANPTTALLNNRTGDTQKTDIIVKETPVPIRMAHQPLSQP